MKRLIMLAALASAMTMLWPYAAWAQETPGTVSVAGQATLVLPPDQVELTVGVTTLQATAQEAAKANAAAMERVIKALKDNLDKADSLRTVSYRVYPRYKWDPAKKENQLVGYEANNRVRVLSNRPGRAGGILDAATKAGANQILGPHWTVSNRSQVVQRAQVAAFRDARAKAVALATAAGAKLGGVKSISAQEVGERPVPYLQSKRGMVADASAPTPMEAGVKKIRGRVRCVFYLQRR